MEKSILLDARSGCCECIYYNYIKTLTKVTHTECFIFIQCLVEPLLEEREVSLSVTPSVSATATKNPQGVHYLEKRTKKRDCIVCSDKSEEHHLTLFVCQTCPENPAL